MSITTQKARIEALIAQAMGPGICGPRLPTARHPMSGHRNGTVNRWMPSKEALNRHRIAEAAVFAASLVQERRVA